MSTVTEIEAAIQKLPPAELAKLREWFLAFDSDAWDKQIEADAAAGKLDGLAAEAMADYNKGKAREL